MLYLRYLLLTASLPTIQSTSQCQLLCRHECLLHIAFSEFRCKAVVKLWVLWTISLIASQTIPISAYYEVGKPERPGQMRFTGKTVVPKCLSLKFYEQ